MSDETESGLKRSTVCRTLVAVVILTAIAVALFSVLVAKGLAQERLDIVAATGVERNCTVVSIEVQARQLANIWWWAIYSVGLTGQQSQAVYYNTATQEGRDLSHYQAGDNITCYCLESQARCVLWSPTNRDPGLEGLIIGLMVSVVCLAVFGCFTGETIRIMLVRGQLKWHGCYYYDQLEERRPINIV